MQIAPNTVASLAYVLTNTQGETLDQADTQQPFVYMHGAHNIIPGLENALTGKQAGDTLEVTIPPEQAYGLKDDSLMQEVPRSMFAGVEEEQIIPGAEFHAQTNAGMQTIVITAVNGDTITIDGNHPLAGQTLHFDVTVLDVRAATKDEICHGHAHGPGGHHHH